jgi:wyosine [tRNA(Phe)-imidazoG37] synthetase (radical SAM superfamily)
MTEYHGIKAFAREEPRIELIAEMLESILALVDLECEGEPVRVDGFRLRDLEAWRTAPELSLEQNLGSLSTACNCRCTFCYEDGNPPGLFDREPRFVSPQEALTRRRYLHDGRGLPRESKGFFEPLANPDFLELFRIVREAEPEHVLDVTTNGAQLSDEVIEGLVELKPAYVNVSLISSDEPTRRLVMRDRRAATAIQAIATMRKREIPFMGTLVPSPDQSLDDVQETIEYLDANEARLIRVAMPGLSRFHPRFRAGELEEWVPRVRDRVLEVRSRLSTPVIVSPYAHITSSIDAVAEGAVRNSPAARAGIVLGDRVLSIDGRQVVSRAHAASLLDRASRRGAAELEIEHDGHCRTIALAEPPEGEDLYPYRPRGYGSLDFAGMRFGLVLPGSFHLQWIKQIYAAVHARAPRSVVVVVSRFFESLVAELLADLPLPEGCEVELLTPKNRYFGGTVDVGDLWVLDDIAQAVREYGAQRRMPELLLLPDSFLSRWGRDLLGVPYTELAAALGVEVALIHCERIVL